MGAISTNLLHRYLNLESRLTMLDGFLHWPGDFTSWCSEKGHGYVTRPVLLRLLQRNAKTQL